MVGWDKGVYAVSIHSSFRTSSKGSKHRNVLSRLERLEKLEAAGRWSSAEQGCTGMPKVRSIKVAMKKKKKEKDAAAETPAAEEKK